MWRYTYKLKMMMMMMMMMMMLQTSANESLRPQTKVYNNVTDQHESKTNDILETSKSMES